MTGSGITRRQFLGRAAGAAALIGATARPTWAGPLTGRVVRAYSPSATRDFIPQGDVIREMVRAGLATLTGSRTAEEAVAALVPRVGPEDRFVIKVNAAGSPMRVGTRPETVRAVVELLRSLPTADGYRVRAEQITVWDNAPVDHVEEVVEDLAQCLPTYRRSEWDIAPGAGLQLPHPPDDSPLEIQRVVADADHVINLSALKHHPLTGTTGVMKNYFGAVIRAWDLHSHQPWMMTRKLGPWRLESEASLKVTDDTGQSAVATAPAGEYTDESLAQVIGQQTQGFSAHPFQYQGQYLLLATGGRRATQMTVEGPLAEAIGMPVGNCYATEIRKTVPEMYATPELGGKTRFSIIDGIQALYDRGPYIEPQEWVSTNEPTPNCLLIGTDPVAMDQAMTDVIVRERSRRNDLEEAPFDLAYLEYAEEIGLGTRAYRLIAAAVR